MTRFQRSADDLAATLPETVTAAWTEFEAADRLMGERCAVEYGYQPHAYVEDRRYVVEEVCDTLPARPLNDLRARGAWLAFQADAEGSHHPDERRTLVATLRADNERMGARLREKEAEDVQTGLTRQDNETVPHPGADPDPDPPPSKPDTVPPPAPRGARALLAEGLTDREIARRVGLSTTTVGRPAQGRVVIACAKTAGLAPRRTSFRP